MVARLSCWCYQDLFTRMNKKKHKLSQKNYSLKSDAY
ncbi:MAG: hypothetical protein ACI93L_003521 [Cyclobacteriaceae bacterium]|jgi:hypothetical protein